MHDFLLKFLLSEERADSQPSKIDSSEKQFSSGSIEEEAKFFDFKSRRKLDLSKFL